MKITVAAIVDSGICRSRREIEGVLGLAPIGSQAGCSPMVITE